MTREEAKKRLEVWLICANCPEDKMCYDSHLHSICEYTDYCDEVPIKEAVKVAIEALEQDEYIKVPKNALKYRTAGIVAYNAEWLKNHFDIERAVICGVQEHYEDAISRQAVLDITWEEPSYTDAMNVLTEVRDKVKELPPVNPQKPICPSAGVDCEDCPAYEKKSEWEHDHEILKAYSDGANAVLDNVRAEIESKYESIPETFYHYETGFTDALEWVLSIIDKYKAEGSGEK